MMKVCCLFLFSLVIVMPVWASTSESDIVLQPVNTTEVDEDGILFLQVKETTSWSEAEDQQKQCTKSKVPWGKKGEISVNVVNGTNLTVSLALPPKKQIFTHSKKDKKAPTSAMVYLEFEGPEDGCYTPDEFIHPDEFTLAGAEDDESFFVLSTRTVGDSRIEVLNKKTFVGVSRCQLSISLFLNFTHCQDWHGDEGDILKLAVPITEKFTYTDLVNVTYRFEPCISYISFTYGKRGMRFLEEPESAIKTVENCPFNQTRYEEGLCQVCPTPSQAPTTSPPVAPSTTTTSGLDAGSYVILSIMGVGFILTVGIVIQSYRK